MYIPVAVYGLDGSFVGYSIKDVRAIKLQTTNLYGEDEQPQLHEQVAKLNEQLGIKSKWPDTRDPDVLKLTEDPNWEPIEWKDEEVIDEANSYLKYEQVEELDPMTGAPTGRWVDGPHLDRNASVLNFAMKRVPARPSDYYERIKKAQEVVARARV